MKIIKSPEESGLGIKVFSEIIQNEAKEQEDGFLIMLFNTLGASLLQIFLIPPHLLTNFELQKYYQNEPKFNVVYSRNNLTKRKDGAYAVNLEEFKSVVVTHWIDLYVNGNNIIYFVSFGVSKEKKIIHRKQKYHNK